ncbi:hypothetical protein GGI21_006827, partial [Coemansia aciculifera]
MAGGKKAATDFKARAKAKTRDAPKTKKKRQGISARRAHNPAAATAAAVPAVAPAAAESEDDDEPIDDEDMEFVRENASSLSFLSSVNPEKLAKIAKEAKVKRMKGRDKPKVAAPTELSDTEDEADSEDMGIVAEDSDSDLEVYSEGEEEEEDDDEEDGYEFRNSKSRRVQKRKAMMDGAMSYEQETRAFEQAEKRPKVSNRLPIKTADGRLVVSDESEHEESENDESEEEEESKVSDDDKMDVSDDESEAETEDVSKPEAPKRSADDGTADYSAEPDRSQMTRKEYI